MSSGCHIEVLCLLKHAAAEVRAEEARRVEVHRAELGLAPENFAALFVGGRWTERGLAETLAQMEGPTYIARGPVDKPANLKRTRKLILQAFAAQIDLVAAKGSRSRCPRGSECS